MNAKNTNKITSLYKKVIGGFFLLVLCVVSLVTILPVANANVYDFPYVTVTLMNQDPDPGTQGEYIDLRWKVEKAGNREIEDLDFFLEAEYPFLFDSGDKPLKQVNDWWGYSDEDAFYTLHYKLRIAKDALEDTYQLKLKYRHNNAEDWIVNEYDIRIGDNNVSNFAIGSLSTDPTKLVADTNEAAFSVEIENYGDGTAQNVKAKLVLPEGIEASYGYSDWENLGTIDAGSSDTATYYVDVDEDVSPGEKQGKIILQYKESDDQDNEIKTVELPLKILVNDKPMFEIIDVSTIPEQIHAGDTTTVKIQVKNMGGKAAESVSIRAYKESSQPFDFDEKYDFIGKLEPGDSGEGLLDIVIDQDAPAKKHIVDMEVRYIYNDEVFIQEDRFVIVIHDGELDASAGSNGLLVGIIGIVMVFIVVGYEIYKRVIKKK